jgi:hypothetical protein
MEFPSIGNVKGVMLCARPPAFSERRPHSSQPNGQRPFVLAIAHSEVGYPSTRESFPHQIRKPPNPTTKYKAWLQSFQNAKNEVMSELVQRQSTAESKRAQLSARTASERARIRARSAHEARQERPDCPPSLFAARASGTWEHSAEPQHWWPPSQLLDSLSPSSLPQSFDDAASSYFGHSSNTSFQSSQFDSQPDMSPEGSNAESFAVRYPTSVPQSAPQSASQTFTHSLPSTSIHLPAQISQPPSRASTARPAHSKPAWALTKQQSDDLEADEVDDLLQFTENLDYDKYMEDLEIDETLSSLEQRIAQLEAEKAEREALKQRQLDMQQQAQQLPDNHVASTLLDTLQMEGQADESDQHHDELLAKLQSQAVALAAKRRRRQEAAAAVTSANGSLPESNSAVAEARALLNQSRTLRSVHSSQSVAAISRLVQHQPVDENAVRIGSKVDPSRTFLAFFDSSFEVKCWIYCLFFTRFVGTNSGSAF